MILCTFQNLVLINTFLIILVAYFMIGFTLYSVKKSDIKLLSAVADSVKKGPRGRKDLLERKTKHESELILSFLWPKTLWLNLCPLILEKLKNTKIVTKLRQLKNAKSKKEN